MDRFADHYEAVDAGEEPPVKAAGSKKRKRNAEEEEEEEEEKEDDDDVIFGPVDLDAADEDEEEGDEDEEEEGGAGGGNEKYGDFFDPPSLVDLQGQSIHEMQQQEDDEDLEDRGVEDDERDGLMEEEEEEEEGEQAEVEEEEDEDEQRSKAKKKTKKTNLKSAEQQQVEDEFSGYFSRLSSAQRKRDEAEAESARVALLSSFQRMRHSQQAQLAQVERALVTPKTWSQRGEITALERPADSLLNEELQIELAGKPKELMTSSVHASIEAMIKTRVSQQKFDDPKRTAAPKVRTQKIEAGEEVSSEKSEKGLADIYAESYLAAQAAAEAEEEGEESVDGVKKKAAPKNKAAQELEIAHREINSLFVSLCSELDALSHYEFAPVHRVDLRVVRNDAAGDLLAREEIGIDFEQSGLNLTSSDVKHGASKKQREMVGEAEKSSGERQRQRRGRKSAVKRTKQHQANRKAMSQPDAIDAALMAAREAKNAKKSLTASGGGELQASWTQAQLKSAANSRVVRKGNQMLEQSKGGAGKTGSSKEFFANLQAHVKMVEQDARKEGFDV